LSVILNNANGAEKTKADKHHTTMHSKYLAFYGTVNVEVVDNLPWYNSIFVKEAEMNFKQHCQDHVLSWPGIIDNTRCGIILSQIIILYKLLM